MRTSSIRLAALVALVVAPLAAHAQPGPGPALVGIAGPPPGPARGAEFLLAHTGELQLNDQQVVRLAAVARHTETRRKAMRATIDSMRTAQRPTGPDSARRGPGRRPFGPPGAMPNGAPDGAPNLAAVERMRDQQRADLRDAIAVLTPEQQATAWMMISRPAPRAGRIAQRGPGRMRGPGADGQRGPAFSPRRDSPRRDGDRPPRPAGPPAEDTLGAPPA